MLTVDGVTKQYDKLLALNDVSFDVREGEILGVLGENGAGKTTLINLITSMRYPTSGTITLDDYSYGSSSYMGCIGACFGGDATLYSRLSVRENLEYFAALHGIEDAGSDIGRLSEDLEFGSYLDKHVSDLSRGMQQRVYVAAALINDPQVVLMDEPTLGLDVSGQLQVKDITDRLCKQGRMVVYSTNILPEITELCDRVLILHKGRQIECDTIPHLEQRYGKRLESLFIDIIGGQHK